MTSTETNRVRRITTARVHSRGRAKEVIFECGPPGDALILRLKGERKRFRLPLSIAYSMAVQAYVNGQKAQRKAERAARKAARS